MGTMAIFSDDLLLLLMALAALTIASVAAWATIIVISTMVAAQEQWGVLEWESTSAALSRYVFVIPGALLSAYGMWLQREQLPREQPPPPSSAAASPTRTPRPDPALRVIGGLARASTAAAGGGTVCPTQVGPAS